MFSGFFVVLLVRFRYPTVLTSYRSSSLIEWKQKTVQLCIVCTCIVHGAQPGDCSLSSPSPPPPPTLNATATAVVVTRTYYDRGIVAGLRRTTRNSAHLQCRQTCVVYEWSVVVVVSRRSFSRSPRSPPRQTNNINDTNNNYLSSDFSRFFPNFTSRFIQNVTTRDAWGAVDVVVEVRKLLLSLLFYRHIL